MQIKQNVNKKKIIIIGALIATFIAAGVTAYFLNQNSRQEVRPENTPDYNPPSDEQKEAGNQAKQDFIEKQDQAARDETANPEATPKEEQLVDLIISSANQERSILQIRTIIETFDASGVCSAELIRSGVDTVTQEAGTQILGSYSVCKGFDMPVGNTQKGSWQVKVSYKGSAGQSGSAQRTVEIK